MARVFHFELHNAPPEVCEVFETTLRGKPGSFHKLLTHRPEVLKTMLPFYGSIGKALGRRLYELVYIRVSLMNGCRYCMEHHFAASRRVGVTPEEWQSLNASSYDNFTPKERAALSFAEKLTRDPHAISDEDINTLKQQFSEAEIVDLDLLIGLANLTNCFTESRGAELESAEEKIL